MECSTADLFDDYADILDCALPIFKSYGAISSFCGEIVSLKVHEDNSLVRETLSTNGKGKVLVVDGGGSLRCALVGDRLAQKAIDNEWAGIIVYGSIRDSKLINEMQVGIRALNTCPVKSIKRGVGLIGETLKFASVNFKPGEFIYVDEDGIAVSREWLV